MTLALICLGVLSIQTPTIPACRSRVAQSRWNLITVKIQFIRTSLCKRRQFSSLLLCPGRTLAPTHSQKVVMVWFEASREKWTNKSQLRGGSNFTEKLQFSTRPGEGGVARISQELVPEWNYFLLPLTSGVSDSTSVFGKPVTLVILILLLGIAA